LARWKRSQSKQPEIRTASASPSQSKAGFAHDAIRRAASAFWKSTTARAYLISKSSPMRNCRTMRRK
jgi:hypothetical protein